MRLILASIFIGISVLIPFKFYYLLFTLVIDLNSGWVFGTFFIRALVIIFFTIGLHLIFSHFKKTQKIKFIYTLLMSLLPGFGISFIQPIYNVDYGLYSTEYKLDYEDFKMTTGELLDNEKNNHIIAFFTPDCGHCQTASYLIGINEMAGQEINTYAIFNSDMASIQKFLGDNQGDEFFAHNIGDMDKYLYYSEFEFPSIYLLDSEGTTLNHWTGDMFNYSALDYILDMEVSE